MSRIAEQQVSFADWELVRQGQRLDPFLQSISDFLDSQNDLIEQVRCDLVRGFTRFLLDGRICLSNNAAERALRGIALGRKSWLFAGSDRGGERAAIMLMRIPAMATMRSDAWRPVDPVDDDHGGA